MSSQELLLLGGILSDLVIDANMPDNLITDTIAPILQSQFENLQGASTSTSLSDTAINWIRRRRMTTPGIFDLPDIVLVRISSYLCTPSRALLALSLTADSKSWRKYKWNFNKKVSPILAWANVKLREPSDQSKVILSSQNWQYLDFGEFVRGEGKLYLRLNDDDIAGVLACINARDNLKTLKIAGCISMNGQGLQQYMVR